MNRPLTWRDAQAAADHLSAADRRTLLLLARMPLLWIHAIQSIEGLSGPSSIYRTLNRLRLAGLVASMTPGLGVLPAQRVWHLTCLGLAVVVIDQDVEFSALTRQLGVSEAKLASLVAALPHRAILYSLVTAIADSGPGRPELLAWEHPWRRRFWPSKSKSPLSVRLPAYVAFRWENSATDFLLIADRGDLPLKAYRSRLTSLGQLRIAGGRVPSIVVHTSTIERSHAWEALMEDVGRQYGGESLPYIPFVPEALDDDLRLDILERGDEGAPLVGRRRAKPLHPRRPWSHLIVPSLRAQTPEFDLRTVQNLTAGHRAALALVAAHPFLTTAQVGRFFGWPPFVTQLIIDDLLRWNMLIPLGAEGDGLEATIAGLEVVAAEQGESLGFIGRRKRLVGGGLATPFGARRSLIRHLAHTQGVNEFFVALNESASRSVGELLEWQNAGECYHWPAHPDGYGVLRLNGGDSGFFLEFDRGTMSARDYFDKLSAYYDYRDSQRFERDYDGFPTILFVTTTDVAEKRFASAADAASLGRGAPLPVLLTANWRITDETNRLGALAAIWRTPADPFNLRRSWPTPSAALRSSSTVWDSAQP